MSIEQLGQRYRLRKLAEVAEQEQSISLSLVKWQPDNVDKIFIRIVINSVKTGMVEFRWTREQFYQALRQMEATGSFETVKPLKELHFDLDYDT